MPVCSKVTHKTTIGSSDPESNINGKAILYLGIFSLSHTRLFASSSLSPSSLSPASFGAEGLGFRVGGEVRQDSPLQYLEERSGEAGRPSGGCGCRGSVAGNGGATGRAVDEAG